MLMRVGVIGAGLMGSGMVKTIAAGGHGVTVHARTAAKAEGLPATPATTILGAVNGADVAVLSVTDSEDVLAVVAEVMRAPVPPPLIIDTSTIAPAAAIEAAAIAAHGGSQYLDCPVSGGPAGAAAGTLAVMCGGTDEAAASAAPLLDLIGDPAKRVHGGPVGAGLVAVISAGAAEAFGMGQRAGVSPEVLARVVMVSSGDSWQLRNLFPRVTAGDHAPGFRARDLTKDLRHARGLAGTPLLIGDPVARLFDDVDGALDYGAVARLFMAPPEEPA